PVDPPSTLGLLRDLPLDYPLWTNPPPFGLPVDTLCHISSHNLLALGSMDAPPDEGKPRPVRTRTEEGAGASDTPVSRLCPCCSLVCALMIRAARNWRRWRGELSLFSSEDGF
ncbi:hypothetical protein FRC09_012162, partial [Ceratobasidium sp. 395]